MKRHDGQRLDDIETAVATVRSYLARGDLSDGLIFDAVRIRLLEIGEAVKAISPLLLATEAGIPWKNIAAMRDQLAHRYFDTDHAIVSGTPPTGFPGSWLSGGDDSDKGVEATEVVGVAGVEDSPVCMCGRGDEQVHRASPRLAA